MQNLKFEYSIFMLIQYQKIMSSNKNNNIFEKTSFLGNNSSEFVETLYADYLSNPDKLPKEWKIFFEGLNEKREKIIKNANGPSWSRKRKIKNIS